MARSKAITTQLLNNRSWSKDVRWNVSLRCDHLGNVHEVETQAAYGYGDGATYGYARTSISPFDDLGHLIEQTMIDAAVNCAEQLVLFHEQ